ncbi:MAG: hypothetical protein AAFZ07_25635 [Actinomycetota bacterium]
MTEAPADRAQAERELHEVALQLAMHNLAYSASVRESARTRAAFAASAATAAGAVLGGAYLDRDPTTGSTVAAVFSLVTYLAMVGVTVYVVTPRTFQYPDSSDLLFRCEDDEEQLATGPRRQAALSVGRIVKSNLRVGSRLSRGVTVVVGLLPTLVVLLAAAVALSEKA